MIPPVEIKCPHCPIYCEHCGNDGVVDHVCRIRDFRDLPEPRHGVPGDPKLNVVRVCPVCKRKVVISPAVRFRPDGVVEYKTSDAFIVGLEP